MARDSRTRTFRLVAYGVFIGFATLYVVLIARGIILSLMHEGALPPAHVSNECRRAPDSCARSLVDLRDALVRESCALEQAGTRAEGLWDDWLQGWRRDLFALRDECCLVPGGAPPERTRMVRAAADLERLGQLYTTHLVQYAREIGPQAERCATDLAVIAPASAPAGGAQAPTSAPANP